MRSCVRKGEREEARHRSWRKEPLREISSRSPPTHCTRCRRHVAACVRPNFAVRARERDERGVKGRGSERGEKKREAETHKRYIGAIKGDRQGHRGSEERDTDGRGRETEEAAIEWERYGLRGSERATGSSSGARETDGDGGESVTDIFPKRVWSKKGGGRGHAGLERARARERQRHTSLWWERGAVESGRDRGATRAVLPPIGNVASAPHPGQCRASSDGEFLRQCGFLSESRGAREGSFYNVPSTLVLFRGHS